jgi:hypothetical protein
MVLFAIGVVVYALRTQTVTCERDAGTQAALCSVSTTFLGLSISQSRTFVASHVEIVQVYRLKLGDGLYVLRPDGRIGDDVAIQGSGDDVFERSAAVTRFFSDPQQLSVTFESARPAAGMPGIDIVVVLVALLIVGAAFALLRARWSSVTIVVDPSRRRIDVSTRRWLWGRALQEVAWNERTRFVLNDDLSTRALSEHWVALDHHLGSRELLWRALSTARAERAVARLNKILDDAAPPNL